MSPVPATIRVSGVVLRNEAGHVLTVRKRGTSRFMLPGGKPERDEGPEATAIRECAEELGLGLRTTDLSLLGGFRAPAANEVGRVVESTVYLHPLPGEPTASGEIEEVRWLDPRCARSFSDLAPLLSDHVVPALLAMAEGPARR